MRYRGEGGQDSQVLLQAPGKRGIAPPFLGQVGHEISSASRLLKQSRQPEKGGGLGSTLTLASPQRSKPTRIDAIKWDLPDCRVGPYLVCASGSDRIHSWPRAERAHTVYVTGCSCAHGRSGLIMNFAGEGVQVAIGLHQLVPDQG